MDQFKGQAEKFHLSFVSDLGTSERVLCEIGLEGVVLKSSDGSRTLKKYPLNHISRWALRGTSLVLYTKTPADVEERTVTLQAGESTIRSVLDTLTCSCMQMCELLQNGEQSGERTQAASSLSTLLSGGARKRAELPTQDEVEYWHKAEKSGWLQSQGEHLRTWRRRWFVLKQGFLFRFADQNVVAATKPRGIVDLSKVTDVGSGRDTTGKNNSVTLSTATGTVNYIADSETEQVEWVSALEGAVAKIVRAVAGVEDEDHAPPPSNNSASNNSNWSSQLEKGFASMSKGGSSSNSSRPVGNAMVDIVGYGGGGGSGGHAAHRSSSMARDNGDYGSTSINYGQIAGIAGVANDDVSRSSHSSVQVSYPAYPTLQPITSNPPASSYNQYLPAPAQQEHSYDSMQGYGSQGHSGQGQLGQGMQTYYQQPQVQQQSQAVHQQQQQQQQPYQDLHNSQGGSSYMQQLSQAPASYQGAPAAQTQESSVWQTHYTPEGRPYYFNPTTNVTQWEPPSSLM